MTFSAACWNNYSEKNKFFHYKAAKNVRRK